MKLQVKMVIYAAINQWIKI